MATYYAITGGGNWGTAGTWNTASNQSTGNAGAAPAATDTCYLDQYSGNVTLAGVGSCAALNASGYTNTLAFGTNTLYTAGDVTLDGNRCTCSTGGIRNNTSGTFTISNIFPGNFILYNNLVLGADLVISGELFVLATSVITGAHDITAATWQMSGYKTLTIPAGRRLTITTGVCAQGLPYAGGALPATVQSGTYSSKAYLAYTGAASALCVSKTVFTDIDFSTYSTPVTNLDNWYGGTLTRVGNTVFTVTAANATAGATYTNNGQTFTVDATISGGTTLTCTRQSSLEPAASGTLTKASGTGDSTITFSAATLGGIINRTSADIPTDAAIAAAVWAYANRTLTA